MRCAIADPIFAFLLDSHLQLSRRIRFLLTFGRGQISIRWSYPDFVPPAPKIRIVTWVWMGPRSWMFLFFSRPSMYLLSRCFILWAHETILPLVNTGGGGGKKNDWRYTISPVKQTNYSPLTRLKASFYWPIQPNKSLLHGWKEDVVIFCIAFPSQRLYDRRLLRLGDI